MMALRVDDPSPAATPANDADGGRRVRGEMTGSPSFGGTGKCMTAEAVEAWVKAARAGDELIYAEGHLPVWAKAPRRLRDLYADGLVALTMDHRQTPKHYIAQRTARSWPASARPRRRVGRQIPNKDPHLAVLAELLAEWAERGEPCRTNAAIARLMGIADKVRVSYLLRCLVGEGLIRNVAIAEPPFRVITIVATGKATGRGAGA